MHLAPRPTRPLWIPLALMFAVPLGADAQERPAAPAAPAARLLQHVPADALAVLRFRNAQKVNDGFRDFAQRIGVADLAPGLADPLRFTLGEIDVRQGFDAGGDVAIALFAPAGQGGPPRAMVFVPVNDYAAFVGNFQDAKKDGQADVAQVPKLGETFLVRRGNYAVLMGERDLLQRLDKPRDAARGGFRIAPALSQAWEGRDIGFYVNMPAVRDAYGKEIADAKKMVDQARVGNPKQDMLARVLGGQLHGGLTQFMDDAEGLLIGFTVDKQGVGHTLAAHFKPGTPTAKLLAPAKNTEADLLTGIPEDPNFKYLVVGGWAHEAGGVWKLVEVTYSTLAQGMGMNEAEATPVRQYLDLIKNLFAAGGGGAFGVIPPVRGKYQPFFRGVAVLNGDSGELLAGYRKAVERKPGDEVAPGKARRPGVAPQDRLRWKTSYQPGERTIGGVKLDRYTMGLDGTPGSNTEEQVKMAVNIFYGKEMEGYLGPLDEKRLLTVVNLHESEIKLAAAAAKAGDAKVDDTKAGKDAVARRKMIQSVNAHLPRSRVAVFYVFLGEWAETVADIARQFGITLPPDVIPGNLPPIGVTVGFEDKAGEGVTGRLDSYVPSHLVAGLVHAAKKVTGEADKQPAQAGL